MHRMGSSRVDEIQCGVDDHMRLFSMRNFDRKAVQIGVVQSEFRTDYDVMEKNSSHFLSRIFSEVKVRR